MPESSLSGGSNHRGRFIVFAVGSEFSAFPTKIGQDFGGRHGGRLFFFYTEFERMYLVNEGENSVEAYFYFSYF